MLPSFLSSKPKFHLTVKLDSFTRIDHSEATEYSPCKKKRKRKKGGGRNKQTNLTQPVAYQAPVVIRNFKVGQDFYSRCVVVHGFIKINAEVLGLPPVVICGGQILGATFALNKKSTLKTHCSTPFTSTPMFFRALSNSIAYYTPWKN